MVGPPTPHRESIPNLVHQVLWQTWVVAQTEYSLENVEGPVPFHSAWMEGGRQNPIRTGMAVLELWTGVVQWRSNAVARTLSVIVMDETWVRGRDGEKPASPTFETFVVSILQDDQSGVKQFFNGMSRTPNGGRPIISGGAVRRGCMIWQTMQIGVAAR